ncbi:response regulator [Seonamhaeicola sp. NFXS20]|uniref:hybrid sensor histidine kinase/response regulator transcription factor n=1 Tax=Seonamhaeicola sp. NFXS20 TaxID=2816959 RepID=UPI003B8ADF00
MRFFSYTTILYLFLCFTSLLVAQNIELKTVLTDKDGLPQNKVKHLIYDQYKYIWLGTQNGISKFNGYSFKNYPEILGKEVTAMFLDPKNNLWIGTREGLYLLNRVSDKLSFVSSDYIRDITSYNNQIYFITPDQLFSINSNNQIVQIQLPDTLNDFRKLAFYNNHLFIGFGKNNGLKRFELTSTTAKHTNDILNQSIIYCLKIIDKNLWVGTSTGSLYKFDGNNLKTIELNNSHPIQDISPVKDNIWVGTDGNGIFSIKGDALNKHYFDLSNEKIEIGSNNVHSILTTNENDIWVGTNDSGVSYFSTLKNQFTNLSEKYESTFVHLNKPSTTCFEDNEKNLYFGTNYGLTKISPDTKKSTSINLTESLSQIGGSKILSIFKSSTSNIWIGTFDGGLGRFNSALKPIKTYYPFSKGSKNQQAINFISNYSENEILINSMFKGLGILNITKGTIEKIPLISSDTILNYQNQTIRKFDNNIYTYVFDRDVCLFNRQKNILSPLFNPPAQINDLYRNYDGSFWLATRGSGLYLVNPTGKILKHLDTDDGLSSNFLLRIEKDNFDNLWISSISGLNKLDNNNNIYSYSSKDGLPSREFKPFASLKLHNGNIVFGTLQGFILVDPKYHDISPDQSKAIISDIKFQNQSIKNLGSNKFLQEPIENTSRIELPFTRNSFSIHFFNDDYSLPKSSKYKYRLLGLESDWISIEDNTQTSYTNLSPGTYKFEILPASNNSYNVNQTPTELYIDILSPWYWSKYTIPLYILLLLLAFYFTYRIIVYKAHVNKERALAEYKLSSMKALNEEKISFFTNISHDIKTPLSLITAPLDILLNDSEATPANKQNLNLIKKNTDRLLQLISNILDFRTLDTNHKLRLGISKVNVESLLDELNDAFSTTCEKRGIKLKIINNCETPVYIDSNKVKRILWNLTSNAIDYCPKNSSIKIHCSLTSSSKLKISVQDSGKGLNEEELEHLFDPYFKGQALKSNSYQGTGLGLSIVKRLIDAHQGNIKIDSKINQGSTFTITIPCKKENYKKEEITNRKKKKENFSTTPTNTNSNVKSKYKLPVLFIVEDNIELNGFLSNFLNPHFKIHSFFNGSDALKASKKKTPDLIISDVLMPEMDGYNLCKAIKSNFLTSHIPVILLTANSSLEHQVEGMQQGADQYLTKPFKPEFLLASVNSILENRNKLREKYQQASTAIKENNSLTQKDKDFLDSLQKFAKENMSTEKTSIDLMCKNLNCSKSVLTRKTKALTGLTPMAFLNTYKLNIAYDLILNEGLNVSEAAFKVGYSDPNYFTLCFKKQFGKNPSELIS